MRKEIVNHLGERAVLIVDGTGGKVFLEGFFQQSMKEVRCFDFIQPLYNGSVKKEFSLFMPGRISPQNPVLKRYLLVFPEEVKYDKQSGNAQIYRIPKTGVPCRMVDYVGDSETLFGLYEPVMRKEGFVVKAKEVK